MLDSEQRQLRARIAIGTRTRGADDPDVVAARREFRTRQAISAIRDAVTSQPHLQPDQLDRIAAAVHVLAVG